MKKFIGCVNGTEYTDRGKFNEAVRKATEEGGTPSDYHAGGKGGLEAVVHQHGQA